MTSKTSEELTRMRRGGRIVAEVLSKVAAEATPGVSLGELNRMAEKLIRKRGATPAFKGYQGFPYATCLSLNEEVVHGLPRQYRLREGDLLGIDIGVLYQGLYADSALTVGIGEISEKDTRLLAVTDVSLWVGIRKIRPGRRLGDIQAAIQQYVEKTGFTIVRDLCGHGIGRSLQEDPQIPNFGKKGTGPVLKEGQTFALEPMVTFHSAHTATKPDGWTVVTLDGKNAAHFEHTVAVTKNGVEVLTLRKDEKRSV